MERLIPKLARRARPRQPQLDADFTALRGLVNNFQASPVGPLWGFTHCLPWEYAAFCAALWRANQAAVSGAPFAWYPGPCYPVNQHGRAQMSTALWASLAVGPEELWAAYNQSRVPHPVEQRLGLARCGEPACVGVRRHLFFGSLVWAAHECAQAGAIVLENVVMPKWWFLIKAGLFFSKWFEWYALTRRRAADALAGAGLVIARGGCRCF